jgi:chromosomal replication initiator protein
MVNTSKLLLVNNINFSTIVDKCKGWCMSSEPQSLWSSVLGYLSKHIKRQSFYTWLMPTVALSQDNGTIRVGVPNKFAADWIREHYLTQINEALANVSSKPITCEFQIKPGKNGNQFDIFPAEPATKDSVHISEPRGVSSYSGKFPLNPKYSFDSFVVGDSNQFAHAASFAVAEAPGRTNYNPLFIYGGVGLGKTHLIQAIGHYCIDTDPATKVIYVTSEKFTNDFISSITEHSVNDFTNLYRNCDILLIDDIQFFTGKESTQEQFFHTFNTLYQNGKQLVLTADRPPTEIKGLMERLLSRFSCGLVVDIQPPNLETRIAILKKKCEFDEICMPLDVISFIAESVKSNIRELEGCVIRLCAYASLKNKEITVDLAQHVLKDVIRTDRKPLTIEQIQKKVAEIYNLSDEILRAKKKTQDVVLARQVAMYLSRTLTSSSLKVIGAKFGGRDHSTVIHAYNLVIDRMKKDVNFKLQIDSIINSLYV